MNTQSTTGESTTGSRDETAISQVRNTTGYVAILHHALWMRQAHTGVWKEVVNANFDDAIQPTRFAYAIIDAFAHRQRYVRFSAHKRDMCKYDFNSPRHFCLIHENSSTRSLTVTQSFMDS